MGERAQTSPAVFLKRGSGDRKNLCYALVACSGFRDKPELYGATTSIANTAFLSASLKTRLLLAEHSHVERERKLSDHSALVVELSG